MSPVKSVISSHLNESRMATGRNYSSNDRCCSRGKLNFAQKHTIINKEDLTMANYNYGDYEEVAPENINESHMPVLIAGDISGSMAGLPIQNVNKSINRFASDVCKDPKAAGRVDVAVIGFNDAPHIEQNWRPITEMNPVDFAAGGGTNIPAALEKGVEMLRERGHLYEDIGIEVKMPYLILITDGYGGDVTEIAKVIKQRTADRKMKLWVLAVKGYDKKSVAQLTDGKRVFELVNEDGYDFSEFFDFMAVSVKAVSTSAPGQDTVSVKSSIGREGSTCRVPDLDAWLND